MEPSTICFTSRAEYLMTWLCSDHIRRGKSVHALASDFIFFLSNWAILFAPRNLLSKPNIDIQYLPQHISSTFLIWQVCSSYLPGLPKDQFFLYGLQNDSVRLPSHQLLRSLPHSEAWKLSSADIEVLFANQNLALFLLLGLKKQQGP